MQELIAKLQKMSATQLVQKMEKGAENEAEKNAIISILQKRGRDVSPYVDKTPEQIAEEAKLDQKQKKESGKAKILVPKVKSSSTDSGSEATYKKPKEIFFEHDVFKSGAKVKVLNKSKKIEIGETGVLTKVGQYEGKPEPIFAYFKLDKDGSLCSRNLEFLELVP